METRDKIVIIGGVVAVAIILIVVTLAYSSYSTAQNHIIFCNNWYDNLEKRKTQLESQLFPDTTQLNAEISQYNKECSY